ncbi:MAG: AEC family transporter [Anaerolineae bacterium]|nr:AEC family transporter [Anaerolineae bacterium]
MSTSILLKVAYDIILPLFLVIGVAVLVGRRFDPDARPVSTLILYLFSPALVLDGLIHSDLQAGELGQIAALVVGISLLMWLVGEIIARAFRFERKLKSAFLLSIVIMNCGNFGIPLVALAYGGAGEQRAIVYTVVLAVIINTLGVYIASSGSAPARQALLNVFKLPLVYAAVIGLVINLSSSNILTEGGTLEPLGKAVGVLAAAAVPAQLALLGLQIAHTSIKDTGYALPAALATFTRLVIGAALAALLAALLGLEGLTRRVSIIEASTPAGVFGVALATEFGGDARFVSTVVLVSTLASVVTLSILLVLVT